MEVIYSDSWDEKTQQAGTGERIALQQRAEPLCRTTSYKVLRIYFEHTRVCFTMSKEAIKLVLVCSMRETGISDGVSYFSVW